MINVNTPMRFIEGRKVGRLEGRLVSERQKTRGQETVLEGRKVRRLEGRLVSGGQRAREQKVKLFNNSNIDKNIQKLQTDNSYSSSHLYLYSSNNSLPSYLPILQPSNDTFLPSDKRNYTIVNPEKVDYFVKCRENALPYLSEILENSNNETQITEILYILDKMLDAKVEGIDKMYPVLARFNDTKSPNIQTFLAGIYRKTQVPDAFGPLVKMLVQNSIHPPKSNFDPNEEIGGAILSYLNPRFRK